LKQNSSSVKSTLVLLATAPIALAISFVAIYAAVHTGTKIYKSSIASPTWPSVTGEVLTSAVAKGCGKRKGYFLQITYAYVVNEKRRTNDRISYTDHFCSGSRAAAESIAAKYRPGASMQVYYDPQDPSDSVLNRGTQKGVWDFALLTIFLLPISLAGLMMHSVYGQRFGRTRMDLKTLRSRQATLSQGINAEIAERQREKTQQIKRAPDA
jgi:hypothetical protein